MWNYFAQNFKKYLALRGRTSRLEFWSFVTCSLMLLLIGVAITGLFIAIEYYFHVTFKLGSLNAATIGIILFLVTAVVLAMPFISVAVRRMHDAGLTGWLILIPGVNLLLWCLPSKNSGNYFDDDNVFEPSRIIGLSLIWAGFLASIFYAIAAAFLLNAKLVPSANTEEQAQETPAQAEPKAEEQADSITEQEEPVKSIQETEESEPQNEYASPDGFDGELINTEQLDDGTLITLRRHNQKLTARLIQDTNIYDSIEYRNIVGSITIPQEINITGIAKTMSLLTTANTTEIWLRIDDKGFDGYLCAGAIPDPYENDFYMVLDQIQFADENWTVRNLGERTYKFKNGTGIYDVPGTRHSTKIGIISFKGESSPDYSITAITEETTLDKESGTEYPWLRLDIDGKSGWIYGKDVVSENGTPSFPSPKRILEQNLQ
ncbi:MAG: DUF805 domain-containing protein [Treponema sp.]|nr:DUF805 domain-containing protein [Treponema sp.]